MRLNEYKEKTEWVNIELNRLKEKRDQAMGLYVAVVKTNANNVEDDIRRLKSMDILEEIVINYVDKIRNLNNLKYYLSGLIDYTGE